MKLTMVNYYFEWIEGGMGRKGKEEKLRQFLQRLSAVESRTVIAVGDLNIE
jgi:hypothetical protein